MNIIKTNITQPIIQGIEPAAVKVNKASSVPLPTSLGEASKKSLVDHGLTIGKHTVEELNTLLTQSEHEITETLENLKPRKVQLHILEASAEAQQEILEMADKAKEVADEGLELLEVLLPHHGSDTGLVDRLEHGREVLQISQSLLYALDAGMTGLAQIYKSKLLDESEKILAEIKTHYENNKMKLPASVKKWEENIKSEKEALSSYRHKLDTASTVVSVGQLPLDTFSMADKLTYGNQISKGLGLIGLGLGYVISTLDMKDSEEGAAAYNTWVERYKTWQNKTQLKGIIEFLETTQAVITSPSVSKIMAEMHLPRKHYRAEFNKCIRDIQSMPELSAFLQQYDIRLDASIKTKEQFVFLLAHQTGFKKNILAHYILYRESVTKLDQIIGKSDNLLVKREAIVEKKLLQLRPKFDEIFPQFKGENKTALEKDKLLRTYIDHQETLELTTKNALKEMVTKKHELEGKFLKKTLAETRTSFGLSMFTLVCSALLSIGAVASAVPATGIALLFTALAAISTATGWGFMALGYYLSYTYKKSSLSIKSYFDTIALSFNNLAKSIQSYSHLAKHKKLKATAEIVHKLQRIHKKKRDTEYAKNLSEALQDYKKAKVEFDESQRKMDHWKQKANHIKEQLSHNVWKDFAKFADLKLSESPKTFDTLKTLKSVLEECDVSLFNPETKNFLETQLGMNLGELQKKMKKHPEAIEKALKDFFVMNESQLTSFMQAT